MGTPSIVSCMFRVNCDNPTSHNTGDTGMPLVSFFTSGLIGSCFLGPQLVECRDSGGVCWVAPPTDSRLPLSYIGRAEDRSTAPFETAAEKLQYCKKRPYKPGDWRDPGNLWCFYPRKVDNDVTPGPANNCEPDPPRAPYVDEA